MVKRQVAVAFYLTALSALTLAADLRPAAGSAVPTAGVGLTSGVDPQYIEPSVRAADDFFTHANGKWIATTVIPADKPSWSPAYILHEEAQERLRLIIEEAAASTSAAPNTKRARSATSIAASWTRPGSRRSR
jgi:hypothetical protein